MLCRNPEAQLSSGRVEPRWRVGRVAPQRQTATDERDEMQALNMPDVQA